MWILGLYTGRMGLTMMKNLRPEDLDRAECCYGKKRKDKTGSKAEAI